MKRLNVLRLGLALLLLLALGALMGANSEPARLKAGDKAADFTLTDLSGAKHKLSDYSKSGKIVVLEWISPECPVSMRYYDKSKDGKAGAMPSTYDKVKGKDLVWLAVNSLDTSIEGNSLDDNKKMVKNKAIPYAVLLDSDQKVARAYGALTTPDIFIVGADGKLAYTGAVDQGNFKEIPKGTNYVVETVKALRAGKAPAVKSTEPFGCSIF